MQLHKLYILILTIGMAACGSRGDALTDQEEASHGDEHSNEVHLSQEQYERAGVVHGKAEMRRLGAELQVNGVIDVPPQSNVSIHMPYGGFVKYIDMLPGTPVRKGDLLVVIENPEFIQFQQNYLEGLANREYLKAEFDRQEKLFTEEVASGKSYQQAKSAYLANEARIKSEAERLRMIGFNLTRVQSGAVSSSVRLYAPVTGSVREVFANVGKYINPQDVIMSITNAEDLHVELTVYENDIPQVKVGQPIRFTIANRSNEEREAEVFLVGSGVREDRSVTVHGHLKEHYPDLLPGMYVSAFIETDSHDVLTVPEQAVVRYGGKHYVFAYQGQENREYGYEMLEVTKGHTELGYVQVSMVEDSTMVADLTLVTQGAFTLLAKAKNTEEEGGGHHH